MEKAAEVVSQLTAEESQSALLLLSGRDERGQGGVKSHHGRPLAEVVVHGVAPWPQDNAGEAVVADHPAQIPQVLATVAEASRLRLEDAVHPGRQRAEVVEAGRVRPPRLGDHLA